MIEKCPECDAQMLTVSCPGGCFVTAKHETGGVACQLAQAKKRIAELEAVVKLTANVETTEELQALIKAAERIVKHDRTTET